MASPTLADAFLTGVQESLLDTTGVFWPTAELVGYYQIFIGVLAAVKPDALTKSAMMSLVPGVDQELTDPDVTPTQIFRVPANVDGASIIQVAAEQMDDGDPNWYGQPGTDLVQHVVPDPRDQLKFRVYPPNSGNGKVWASYGFTPLAATAATDPFPLPPAYREMARNAVLAMAYSKNTDYGDVAKATFYFSLLETRLGQKLKMENLDLPKLATQETTE